jgi:Uma2 family endonuclease
MTTAPTIKTVTYEEWLLMPEVQDAVEEVVNAQIRIMPAPEWSHGEIIDVVHGLIRPQVDERVAKVVAAPFGLVIRRAPLNVRVPDLSVFKRDTIVVEDGYVHSAPQLVEVVSVSDTKATIEEKLADYSALGVPEVWLVSPEARTVEVLYLEDGRLRRELLLAGDVLTPKHFPTVKVEIAAIWPE